MQFTTRTIAPLLLLAVAIVVAGCGGSGAALEDMPEWVVEKPESENAMYGSGTGSASGLQTAIDKSKMRAQGDIASSIEAQFQSMTEDFREEVGDEELSQFTQTQRQVVDQVLRGVQAEDQKVIKEDDGYRVYTLMRMPVGAAADEFLSQLQTNEEAYTRFRKSEAFKRMQEAVDEYEESRNE
jgi:quinol monooxygenase YgiN